MFGSIGSPAQKDGPRVHEEASLTGILEILRERTGLDFRGYRSAPLLRRVRNRMISARVATLSEYLDLLTGQPEEAARLVERLTIKVSRFYRDPQVFHALRLALSEGAPGRRERPITAWSAGCGNGEEAYSLAILLAELEDRGNAGPGPQVLATDIDQAALARGRCAEYAAADLVEMSPERVERCFEALPARTAPGLASSPAPGLASGPRRRYRVAQPLRSRVEFRFHDLSSDAPTQWDRRFDLICCRNVLIYFLPDLQNRVETLLLRHLLPGGLLCLGEAEWLLPGLLPSFEVMDRKARLFRRILPDNDKPGSSL